MAQIYVDTGGAVGAAGTIGDPHRSLNVAEATLPASLTEPYDVICDNTLSTAADGTSVDFNGSTTTSTNYVHIYTTSNARHAGVWDTSKYRLEQGSSGYTMRLYNRYTRVTGLQIKQSGTGGSNHAALGFFGGGDHIIDACLIITLGGSGSAHGLYVFSNGAGAAGTVKNTISFGCTQSAFHCSASTNLDNCTAVSSNYGIRRDGGTCVARNCYAGGNTTGDFNGTITKTACASADATGTTTGIAFSTSNFVNVTPGSEDFHVTSGTSVPTATRLATALTDIDGDSRTDPTRVGADEFVSGGTNATVNLALSEGEATLFEPTVLAVRNVSVALSLMEGEGALFDPTVVAVNNALFEASLLLGAGTLFAPTVLTGGNVSVALGLLEGEGSLFAPTVAAVRHASVTPALMEGLGVIYEPSVSTGGNILVVLDLMTGQGVLFEPSALTVNHVSVPLDLLVGRGQLFDNIFSASVSSKYVPYPVFYAPWISAHRFGRKQ
jgi:hypothetical protein